MSKKYKWKRSKFKRPYSEKEMLLAKMHKNLTSGKIQGEDKTVAHSLIRYHLQRNGLTPSQWDYADIIIKKSEALNNPKQLEEKQYLYGITDGTMIKLGMSSNINKRLKALQTSNPKTLSVKWEFYTGRNSKVARSLEKKLHRRCSKYRVRGEWFKIGCFELVKVFRGQD